MVGLKFGSSPRQSVHHASWPRLLTPTTTYHGTSLAVGEEIWESQQIEYLPRTKTFEELICSISVIHQLMLILLSSPKP
jgi:hypothetical protein